MDEYSILSDYSLTVDHIAKLLGCSGSTVIRKRRKLNITGKIGSKKGVSKTSLIKERVTIYCKTCGKEMRFTANEASTRKYCCRKCMYGDDDYINVLRSIDRSYMQTEEYRNKLRDEVNVTEYKRYRNRVKSLTEAAYRNNMQIINPYKHPRTLCGVDGGYQLDHIIGIRYGYDNAIPAEIIASVDNLQMLPWKENRMKGEMPS